MVSSILIVRLSAIGDIVMASPLIGALRARYPDARIAWMVQPESQPLLQQHPDLDEVIVWPRRQWQALVRARQWLRLWKEVRRFRRELRGRNFDLAIDAQGLLKSGFLTWLCGAHERIGLGSREGSQWLMSRVVGRGGDSKRIGSEYLYLAQQLGLPSDSFEMHVAVSEADEEYVKDLVDTEDLKSAYLVVCPFTTRPQKHWFESRWIELIPRLESNFGLRVVLLGGPGDQESAQRIQTAVGSRLINQTGVTSLTQAAALIKHAQLLIGVDTGLTHMGIAFNRPTLCLFGSTCPYLDTTHENARVLYHRLPCSPCKRNPTCQGRFDCMRAIGVDEVISHTVSLVYARGETT